MKVQVAGCVPRYDKLLAIEPVKHNAKMTAHNSLCIAHLWTGHSINRISASCQSIAQRDDRTYHSWQVIIQYLH